jgi:PhnB protein
MQPYSPRPIEWMGSASHGDWRIKQYSIVWGGGGLDERRFAGGLPLALAALPDPAVTLRRPGVAVLIRHQGRTADYLVLTWWDNENELPLRVFVRDGDRDDWRSAAEHESFCVWDLEVLWAERNAYVQTMLGGTPDVARYAAASALVGSRSGGGPVAANRKGLPENTSIVIPRLFCRDPAAQIEFCVRALGAVELGRREDPAGQVVHGLLTLGSEMVMIEAEWPTLPSRAPVADGSSPVVVFLYVESVDQTVARAVELGAQVLIPAEDQFWGDRIAWIQDPSGHVWTIATRVEKTTAEERDDRWSALVEEEEKTR